MSNFTPVNQVRITNVAIVRLQKAGCKFEVAAYKNKVIDFRQGIENDLEEVLQIDNVFENVSKGLLAKKSNLEKAFGTTDSAAICNLILHTGVLQVSALERNAQISQTLREITNMIVTKCVESTSKRPFTFAMVENALKVSLAQSRLPLRKTRIRAITKLMFFARRSKFISTFTPRGASSSSSLRRWQA